MKCYVIYRVSDSRVVTAGACPDDEIDKQVPVDAGYARLIVPSLPIDPSRCYVVNGDLREVA